MDLLVSHNHVKFKLTDVSTWPLSVLFLIRVKEYGELSEENYKFRVKIKYQRGFSVSKFEFEIIDRRLV